MLPGNPGWEKNLKSIPSETNAPCQLPIQKINLFYKNFIGQSFGSDNGLLILALLPKPGGLAVECWVQNFLLSSQRPAPFHHPRQDKTI